MMISINNIDDKFDTHYHSFFLRFWFVISFSFSLGLY